MRFPPLDAQNDPVGTRLSRFLFCCKKLGIRFFVVPHQYGKSWDVLQVMHLSAVTCIIYLVHVSNQLFHYAHRVRHAF